MYDYLRIYTYSSHSVQLSVVKPKLSTYIILSFRHSEKLLNDEVDQLPVSFPNRGGYKWLYSCKAPLGETGVALVGGRGTSTDHSDASHMRSSLNLIYIAQEMNRQKSEIQQKSPNQDTDLVELDVG